jgi:hypothetical protein
MYPFRFLSVALLLAPIALPAAITFWVIDKQLTQRRLAQAKQALEDFKAAREQLRNRVWPRRSCWERLLEA